MIRDMPTGSNNNSVVETRLRVANKGLLLVQFAISVVNSGLYQDDGDDGVELTYCGRAYCTCFFNA